MLTALRHFIDSVKRFFFWGWKLRNSHDWDYAYLYKIMALKLERMEYEFKNHGHCEWQEEDSLEWARFTKAVRLMRRLAEDDFDNHYKAHVAKWGELTFSTDSDGFVEFYTERSKREGKREQERREAMKAATADYKERRKALQEFTRLFRLYSNYWWD